MVKHVTKKMTDVSLLMMENRGMQGPEGEDSRAGLRGSVSKHHQRSKSQLPRKVMSMRENLLNDYGR
jgi:hypothetical protein